MRTGFELRSPVLRARKIGLAVLLLAGFCMAPLQAQAQSQLPTLGDGLEMTLSAERRLGDRIARELYRDPDYLDDPVLAEYVQGIWQRLMAAARSRGELTPELEERFAWEVNLGRDRSVNAFALPGGYLGVHLGLIAAVSSEDELAAVLAHELSHVTQRHISRLISRSSEQAPWMIGAMILGALAASKSPNAAGALIAGSQAVALQGQLNFSRDMEREADRVGYGVMQQAGFEPYGAVLMFEKLQQAARFNDTGAFPYLRSHPLTTERMADMQARQQLLTRPVNLGLSMPHALMAARARALSSRHVDALRAQMDEPASAQFASLPAVRQAGVLYGAALAAAFLREHATAQRLHARLMSLLERDVAAQRWIRLLAAELALMAGDTGRARAAVVSGLDLRQRADLLVWAQVLMRTPDAAAVAEQLQTWVARFPRDAQAWQLLSVAYQTQGKTLRSVRAEAESFAARQDLPAAVGRLKSAQDQSRRSPTSDDIEAAIIDARLRQLEALQREQALER